MLLAAGSAALGSAMSSLLKKPVEALYEGATAEMKLFLDKWKTSGARDAIDQKIAEVEMVRTVAHQTQVPLSSFYYPLNIIDARTKQNRRAERLQDISPDQNVLLTGTAGQGKSMYMRYMVVQELRAGRRIPLFIELRNIDTDTNIEGLVRCRLNRLGLSNLSPAAYEFLLKGGNFVLFLDGFDEIKREFAAKVQQDLWNFTVRFPKTQWIVSSRPGSLSEHLSDLPKLCHIQLAKLGPSDLEPFLEKLGVGEYRRKKMVEAIERSSTLIRDVLVTPLMVTLLNITFGVSTHIPETLHEFYEEMFSTLVLRHDETKPGYCREKVSRLNNADLQDVFEVFAFLSKDFGMSLSDEQFSICTKKAAGLTLKSFTADGIKTDFTETVCLMVRDGLKTAFIHKSIQEFFAAFFIKHLGSEEYVKRIYQGLHGTKTFTWRQELKFLAQIDKFRYIKHFQLPAIEDLLTSLGYDPNRRVHVRKQDLLEFLKHRSVFMFRNKHRQSGTTMFVSDGTSADFNIIVCEFMRALFCGMYFPFDDVEQRLLTISTITYQGAAQYLRANPQELEKCIRQCREYADKLYAEKQELERTLSQREQNFAEICGTWHTMEPWSKAA